MRKIKPKAGKETGKKMKTTVELRLNEGSENLSRASGKLLSIMTDFLKAAKICTGDIVILSNGDMSSTVRFLFTAFV